MNRRLLLLVVAVGLMVSTLWVALSQLRSGSRVQLAGFLPPGALLTIESPDFSKLLADWNNSAEQKVWMGSASYSAFANSHLFGRLQTAQDEFTGASSTEISSEFLQQVAGTQSIFAWYDISQLEFVYITHMRSGQAETADLLKQRAKFQRRQAGDTTFYIRSGTSGEDKGQSGGESRTVAFATRGEWLVLATREDLLVNTLGLMQRDLSRSSETTSMAETDWYGKVNGLDRSDSSQLHMVLDLQALTRTPHFRTYWIQRNFTDTRRYRAATADLFREGNVLREERILLPMDAAALADNQQAVTELQAWVPERSTVYRAIASPSADNVWEAIKEKPFALTPKRVDSGRDAPVADLSSPQTGDASDLETTIDTPPLILSASGGGDSLKILLRKMPVAGMLTVDRTVAPVSGGLFVPIQSALVLQANETWNSDALRAAIQQAAEAEITTSGVGAQWRPVTVSGGTYLVMNDARPLALYISAKVAILSSSPALMEDMLSTHQAAASAATPVFLAAGFNHSQERRQYARLMSVLDHGGDSAQSSGGSQAGSNPFFSSEVRSLSDSFSTLETERFLERHDDGVARQTVTYTFHK